MENLKELLLLNSQKNPHSTKLSNSTEVNISEDPSPLRNHKRRTSITEAASDKKELSVIVDPLSEAEMPLKEMPTSKPQPSSLVVFHTTPLPNQSPACSAKSEPSAQQELSPINRLESLEDSDTLNSMMLTLPRKLTLN